MYLVLLFVTATVTYQFTYSGTPPTDAFFKWDYGDGNVSLGPDAAFASPVSTSWTYAEPGRYITTLTIYNKASSIEFTVTVCIVLLITVLSNRMNEMKLCFLVEILMLMSHYLVGVDSMGFREFYWPNRESSAGYVQMIGRYFAPFWHRWGVGILLTRS
jgi:hypothetical protein